MKSFDHKQMFSLTSGFNNYKQNIFQSKKVQMQLTVPNNLDNTRTSKRKIYGLFNCFNHILSSFFVSCCDNCLQFLFKYRYDISINDEKMRI